ncbi:CHRD domain-containing protein [Xylophilus rhododendri]|uniref:CHRD domain-containing protein n=1 Tax=Xylophilus rhododendri TaxID=2697032 RepID=A0A857J335_9BURK|nr:CHRD domain-containing protein [Xylophilus rhododendri]QHI97275.1 CHRD domain-containing protein [Xylophilus rhododendri]
MQKIRRAALGLFAVASIALAAGCATVTDNVATMQARLSPQAEVPPTVSMGQGLAQVWLNKQTGGLRWKVEYSGLSGPATAAHFHGPAAPGANAGVVVPVKLTPIPSPSFEGEAIVSPAQVQQIVDGQWYFNIHSAKYPGGEIRGQVLLVR